MWFLLGTTLTASFFDSLNPSAIAQQMLLQAMVKKKRHIWFFICGIGTANLIMGLAIYYGIATWVSKFLTKIVNAYPLYVYGAAAIGGIVLLGAGIRLIIKTRQSNAGKVVIRNAAITAARTRSRKYKREISLEYLTDEKHYPLGTTDEYFQAPEPDEEYILTLCGDTVIFSSGLLAEALSRLDEREREMIYLSFFKRIPQHEIGRQYGRSRSTAGYHIRKALRQLQAEMEGMAYEK